MLRAIPHVHVGDLLCCARKGRKKGAEQALFDYYNTTPDKAIAGLSVGALKTYFSDIQKLKAPLHVLQSCMSVAPGAQVTLLVRHSTACRLTCITLGGHRDPLAGCHGHGTCNHGRTGCITDVRALRKHGSCTTMHASKGQLCCSPATKAERPDRSSNLMLSGVPPLTPAGSSSESMKVCPRYVVAPTQATGSRAVMSGSSDSAPSMMAATETRPSFAPRTAALSQLLLVL